MLCFACAYVSNRMFQDFCQFLEVALDVTPSCCWRVFNVWPCADVCVFLCRQAWRPGQNCCFSVQVAGRCGGVGGQGTAQLPDPARRGGAVRARTKFRDGVVIVLESSSESVWCRACQHRGVDLDICLRKRHHHAMWLQSASHQMQPVYFCASSTKGLKGCRPKTKDQDRTGTGR